MLALDLISFIYTLFLHFIFTLYINYIVLVYTLAYIDVLLLQKNFFLFCLHFNKITFNCCQVSNDMQIS